MFISRVMTLRVSLLWCAALLASCGGGGGGSSIAPEGGNTSGQASGAYLSTSPSALSFASASSAAQTFTLSGAATGATSVSVQQTCGGIANLSSSPGAGNTLPETLTITPIGPGNCTYTFTDGSLSATLSITVGGASSGGTSGGGSGSGTGSGVGGSVSGGSGSSTITANSFVVTSSSSNGALIWSAQNNNTFGVTIFWTYEDCQNIANASGSCSSSLWLFGQGFPAGTSLTGFAELLPANGSQPASATMHYIVEPTSSGYNIANPPPFS